MRRGWTWLAALVLGLGVAAADAAAAARLATTHADFVQPGSQPSVTLDNFITSPTCQLCHGLYLPAEAVEPWDSWVGSMMAQAARDPVTRAAVSIANQDAALAGEVCIRCHSPIGWLAGRSASGRFEDLLSGDLDGVTCHVCHRLVDPVTRADSPSEDTAIVAGLAVAGARPAGACRTDAAHACTADADCGAGGSCDVDAGQGRYVVDPQDRRRGPFEVFAPHATIVSPYHRRADACAPCHDVSTPTFTRQPDGHYALNALDTPHPTQKPHDMFPEQRTFSEWRASAFAAGGVVFADGRFGGARTAVLPNIVAVSTCQDCHMPTASAAGCVSTAARPDLPVHTFAGANTWVLGAILDAYGTASGLTEAIVTAAAAETETMLRAAADLELVQARATLRVRVVNQTGHKLPTGYPEGRRMWVQVRFFAGDDPTPVHEDGRYDVATATLDVAGTTKIYEAHQVVGSDVAAASGLAAGTSFHLVLNNEIHSDNRIPPRGFTNAAFAAVAAAPAGYTYADGQHWDETTYAIPAGATRAEVTLYYQTTSREYAEFLRDTSPDATGADFHARWVARGRSAPVAMAHATVELVPCPADSGPCCGTPSGFACDDGDACTTGETCAGERCAAALTGFAGFRCELGQLDPPCDVSVTKQVLRAVRRRLRAARAPANAAERKLAHQAPPAQVRRLLDRAGRILGTLRAMRGLDACRAVVSARVDRALAVLAQLRP